MYLIFNNFKQFGYYSDSVFNGKITLDEANKKQIVEQYFKI